MVCDEGLPAVSMALTPSLRSGLALSLALAAGGCVSSTPVYQASDVYYQEGPEQTIRAADQLPSREADLILVALEKAVALLEIGEYAESAAILGASAAELDLQASDAGVAARQAGVGEEAPYRPEGFERVFIHTLAMADWLALQDVATAATEAELALAAVDGVECDACTFPFTRYLAAVTFEALGDPVRALDVLAEAVAESPGLPFLDQELQRMAEAEPCPPFDHPDDLMTPAADSRRVLHVLLLLGRGPEKVPDVVSVPWSDMISWPAYQARWPEGVSGAVLLSEGGRGHRAELLTDVLSLAQTNLRARLARHLSHETGTTVTEGSLAVELGGVQLSLKQVWRDFVAMSSLPDLRHWSTLPATCQVIRVAVDTVEWCELVYLGPDGEPIDSEVLELPAEWESGPLFVTRRMP